MGIFFFFLEISLYPRVQQRCCAVTVMAIIMVHRWRCAIITTRLYKIIKYKQISAYKTRITYLYFFFSNYYVDSRINIVEKVIADAPNMHVCTHECI